MLYNTGLTYIVKVFNSMHILNMKCESANFKNNQDPYYILPRGTAICNAG